MDDRILLLFTPELPCWDAETVSLAGEDPAGLDALLADGKLVRAGGGFVLTECGAAARERAAAEMFVPAEKMTCALPEDADELLRLNLLVQLIDRAFRTLWSVKELTVRESFEVVPCLNDDEYFALENGKARAVWPEAPIVKSFKDAFPNCGHEARKLTPPGESGLEQWAAKNDPMRGTLVFDLMIRHHHDFMHYKGFPAMESDKYGFLNAAPIMFRIVRRDEKPEDLLPFIGRVHLFFLGQRHVYLPGFFDMDSEDQEMWKVLTFVTETEEQLMSLTDALRGFGRDLIEPAIPLFIVGTSIERLRAQKEQKTIMYDWFGEETVKIMRPIEDD